jgi:hypothetical protein
VNGPCLESEQGPVRGQAAQRTAGLSRRTHILGLDDLDVPGLVVWQERQVALEVDSEDL